MKYRLKYRENKTFAWSRIYLESGEPIWIYVTRKGVLIKKSRLGYTGQTLFKNNNLSKIVKKIQLIDERITEIDSAFKISGIFLRVLTHLALLSKTAHGLSLLLNNIFAAEVPPLDAGIKPSVEHRKIIQDFTAFVKNNYSFGQFRDLAELPHPKHIILDALLIELGNEKNAERQEKLRSLALMLVDFQKNVGPKPLNELGMDKAKLHGEIRANRDDLLGMIRKMADHPDRKKYVALKKKADEEFHFINNRIASMKKLKLQMGGSQNDHR